MKSSDIKVLSLLSLGLFASCSTTVIEEKPVEDYAIDFANVSTRAAIDGDFPTGASYSVWGWYVNASGVLNNVFDRTEIKYNGTFWQYDGTKYWSPDCTYSFYAVYPHSVPSSCTVDGTITINGFDASITGDGAIDLMTSKNVVTVPYNTGDTPSAVQIPMVHELARVRFIVKNTGSAGSVNVTKFKISGVPYSGNFSKEPSTDEYGTWNGLQTTIKEDGKFSASSFEITTGGNAEKNVFGDMLMIPVADLTNAEIEYSYSCDGGEPRSATIPIMTSTVTAWEHGQNYSYSITMSTADLSISVNVLPWNEIDSSVSWDDGDKNN